MQQDYLAESQARLEIAPGGSDTLVACVIEAAEAIEAGDRQMAHVHLAGILQHPQPGSTAVQRVAQIVAHSLLARLAGDLSGSGNLYQEAPHPQDMLAAFQLLLHETPFIRFGYESANLAIMDGLVNEPCWHIIDIGIGSGTQWHHLLAALAARGSNIPHVRLTGIDIPAPSPDPAQRLRAVADTLQRLADELSIPFVCDMIASPMEDITATTLAMRADDVIAINAAFALHHIAAGDGVDDPARSRDAVLHRLHQLHPRLVTLTEPEADHNALPFIPRVREALAHYLTVFDELETQIPSDRCALAIIERAFFGREMLNIIASEGTQRIERHERHERWQRRLATLAFAPIGLDHLAGYIAANLSLVPPFDLCMDGGVLSLAWKGVPLVAVSA